MELPLDIVVNNFWVADICPPPDCVLMSLHINSIHNSWFSLLIEAQFARLKEMKVEERIEIDARANSWSHAYLFVGGEESIFLDIINKVTALRQCLKEDITEVRPEDTSGKKGEIKAEGVQQLIRDISLSPHGSIRLGVIYNAEKLNLSAANMLLKSLEEPADHVMFLLFAGSEKILPTIKSRCRLIRLISSGETKGDMDLSFVDETFLEITKKVESITKNNQTNECLDALESMLRQKMLHDKSIITIKLIKKLEAIRSDIRQNANPKLALESLILMIRELKR